MKYCITPSPIIQVGVLLAAVLFCIPSQSMGDSISAQQWEITADKLTRYENPPSVIAEGNVVLEKREAVTRSLKKDTSSQWSGLLGETPEETAQKAEQEETVTEVKTLTTIKADWMVYDVDLGTVKARGNLLIDIGPDQVAAETGRVDLNQETGVFEEATIVRDYKEMHLEGRVIEKTGDLTYHIKDGWIVTCKLKEGETPPWSFAASDVEITDGGYAYLKHATFRIKDVPVLYTPYMIIPAKRKRQTGFLFPAISTSDRDGFGFEIPFFINLSPSSDITLYPQYMANRGFMAGAEFRYVVDQNDKGAFLVNYLNDDLTDPSEVDYYKDYTHTNKDRYWLRGKADQDIGEWTTRVDLDIVSDNDYLTEFNTGPTGFDTTRDRFFEVFGRSFQNRSESSRDNSLTLLRSWESGMSLQGEFLGINDVSEPQVNPSPLWRLPALNFNGLMPIYDTGVNFSWNTDYVHYWREEGVGAQRFDIFPRVTMSVPVSRYLETTVEGGVRDTFYAISENGDSKWDGSDTENRLLFEGNAEIGSTMKRDFDVSIGDVYRWSHTFRPFVAYEYVSDDDEEDVPQFDTVDDIADQNVFTYGINNFFDILGNSSGREYEREYGYLRVEQGYDFRSEESDTPLTPVFFDIGYNPLKYFEFVYRTDLDVYGEGFISHRAEVEYQSQRGDFLSLDYRYDNENNTNSVRADSWLLLPYNLAAGYTIERSIEDSRTIEEIFRIVYQPECWSVELNTNYTPGNKQIMVVFRLANIGNPFGIDMPGY